MEAHMLNVCFVPKTDIRQFSFWNYFCQKLGEGKKDSPVSISF